LYDFVVGGVFVNSFLNPKFGLYEQCKAPMMNCPARVKAYIEAFKAEMKPYLDTRSECDF
jgi:hypothetical protein